MSKIYIYAGSEFPMTFGLEIVYSYVAIALGIIATFYLLRSLGLYTLAKRQNVKNPVLAWIPLLWFYIACKLVGNARFFNKPVEKLALVLTIIFAISGFITFAMDVLAYYPIAINMFAGGVDWAIGAQPTGFTNGDLFVQGIYHSGAIINPYGASGILVVNDILNVLDYISAPLGLVCLVIELTVYMGLFRKFIPQHYLLFMFLSILIGIFGPLVFAIRKKAPVNYIDYMRSRYQYNQYNNPYNRGGYNGNPNNNPYANSRVQQAPPQSPFGEFEARAKKDPTNPFEEFDSDKNEDDK